MAKAVGIYELLFENLVSMVTGKRSYPLCSVVMWYPYLESLPYFSATSSVTVIYLSYTLVF